MLTATERTQTAFQPDEAHRFGVGPVLVATDGTKSADAALRAASVLSTHTGADVVALAVLEGMPLIAGDFGLVIPPIESTDARRRALTQRVRDQLLGLGASTRDWTVEIREGEPAATIASTARELDARVIIVGLGHHELVDRLFGGETALHALRLAGNPVLAVPPDFATMPMQVVVATDFSAASVAAARQALEVIDTASTVYLVHVAPQLEMQPEAFATWMTMFGEGVTTAFERVKTNLGLPDSVTVKTVSRTGRAAREILSFAESVKADLIVTGSRGAGLMGRILVGSTATGILRGARCAVLAVPTGPMDIASAIERLTVARDDWGTELDAFTRRNIGRIAALEVDDPEFGTQFQERDYPFLGTTWDRNDQRVEIMLGDFEGGGRHLTRGIAGVTGIDILRDEDGRDWTLRVSHKPGQTILTFKR